MVINNPTTTTGVTTEFPNSCPLTFVIHTPEQEGLVPPPYISPKIMALILLWTFLIIMFAILWYHVTFPVSGVSKRWHRRKHQDRASRGEEVRLLEDAWSLEGGCLPRAQDLPEEHASDIDAGCAWADENEDEEVDAGSAWLDESEDEEADVDTDENTNQGESGNASPSTPSKPAVSIYGSLDPVPDRRIIEEEVVVITSTEQDNINIRFLTEYNATERWRLNIGILDEAERERVHCQAEWMRAQAHRGLDHSPSDFWYR